MQRCLDFSLDRRLSVTIIQRRRSTTVGRVFPLSAIQLKLSPPTAVHRAAAFGARVGRMMEYAEREVEFCTSHFCSTRPGDRLLLYRAVQQQQRQQQQQLLKLKIDPVTNVTLSGEKLRAYD
jgi:hypothetical protein